MTDIEKEQLLTILRFSQRSFSAAKKKADIQEAIEIANREADVESYFRSEGVEVPDE